MVAYQIKFKGTRVFDFFFKLKEHAIILYHIKNEEKNYYKKFEE